MDTLADMVVKTAQPGDHILVMSNGGFGGIHQKLLDGLAKKAEAAQQRPQPDIVCVADRHSRRIRHLSIVPDATLDASYQAYRHRIRQTILTSTTKITSFILRQFAQILENLACGFRRLIPFFLFLRVADQCTQLLTIGIGPDSISAMASIPDRSTIAQVSSL